MFAFEDDSACSVGTGNEPVTDLQAGTPKGFGGNRDLMLGADLGGSTASFLYFSHICKGKWSDAGRQGRIVQRRKDITSPALFEDRTMDGKVLTPACSRSTVNTLESARKTYVYRAIWGSAGEAHAERHGALQRFLVFSPPRPVKMASWFCGT